MPFLTREALPSDIEFIKILETECALCEWSKEDYLLETGRQDSIFLIVSENSERLGFILARIIEESNESLPKGTAEIYNIAVKSKHRNRGIGTELLLELLRTATKKNVGIIRLEVRKSNRKAFEFYKKLGFKITGERKNFYTNPSEDAFLMELILPDSKSTLT
jgi:ribosomal-protein-alanine N-acetyltransferase